MTPLNSAMTTLLNGIWQGALLTAAVWIILKRVGRVNPTTRFTILWLTLAAVAILPFGPRIRMIVPRPHLRLGPAPAAALDPAATAFTPVEVRQPHAGRENQSASGSQPAPPSGPAQGAAEPIPPPSIAVTKQSPIQIRSGRVMAGLALSWGLLSLLLLARLGAGYRLLRRLKSAAAPGPESWRERWTDLGGTSGMRRQPRFLVSREIATPMSLGFFNPAILIPRSLLETLSEPELDHLVLHELAHLLRYDDWTNLAQKLIEALLPIQPAMFWIGRQMSLEREMACDDWVIAATGRARPYAACLTKVAELSGWQHAGVLAAGAAGGRSQLFRRVDHMLDRTRNAAPKLSFLPIAVALIAMIASIYEGTRAPQIVAFAQNSAEAHGPVAPESPQAPIAPRSPFEPAASPVPPASIAPSVPLAPVVPIAPLPAVASQQQDETHVRITNRNGLTSTDLKIDGSIEFTDDDRDIKSLSANGRFHLDQGSWFSARSYDVRADSAGNLTKSYSVGLHEKPLDDDGRAWLAKVLPEIIRDSGIGASSRVARILRQGGPQAVLSEIGLIHGDGSRRTYLELLFSQATLNTTQLEDAAKLIQGISSDGDKAQVIIDVDSKYFTDDLRPRLFQATDSISSDGDKRKVLSDIARKDAGNPRTLVGVARVAHHISSDGDKAEVLIEIADHYGSSDELRAAYFEAVDSISSDGDHARVLLKLLVAHGSDRETMVRTLRSAGRISSDGDKAGVLIEAAASYTEDESERKAFIDAANSVSSDGDHQRVLVALVHRQGAATATLGAIANSAQRISSDGDKVQVLMALAGENVEPVREAFFAAADSIRSDGDRSRVLLAILDKSGTSNAMAIGAIHSAAGISSDGDKGRVLLDAANRYSNDPAVRSALRQAVESLHSDGEYRAVMTELGRHAGGRSNE